MRVLCSRKENMYTLLLFLYIYIYDISYKCSHTDVSHIVTKVRRMRSILAEVFNLTGVKEQILIIPIVDDNHFFVVMVKFDKQSSPVG